MDSAWLGFWEVVVVGCVIWYALATVYIAIRGAADIRGMLLRLREGHSEEPPPSS